MLKLFLPRYAYAARMEFERARAVYAAGVASPAAFELVEVDGRPGIVFERVDGPTLLDRLREDLGQAVAVGRRLAELHVEIHTHTVPGLEPLLAAGERIAAKLPAAEQPAQRARLARAPRGAALYHGDFHPGNVIAGARTLTIDWVNAFAAHPALDVARSIMAMRYQGLPAELAREALGSIVAVRRTITDAYVARYLEIGTITRAELDAALPLAAAALLRGEPANAEREALETLARSD